MPRHRRFSDDLATLFPHPDREGAISVVQSRVIQDSAAVAIAAGTASGTPPSNGTTIYLKHCKDL